MPECSLCNKEFEKQEDLIKHNKLKHSSNNNQKKVTSSEDNNEENVTISLPKFNKKTLSYLILIAILIFFFYLRSYHVDYPVVGYHNWKEVNHLTKARNFAREGYFEHGFFIPEIDYPFLHSDPSGADKGVFPTYGIITSVMFNIFGMSVGVGRMVVILFSLGTVLGIYLLTRELTNNKYFPLITSFLFAIQPLQVFFGRNAQIDPLGLFFMVFGFYFFFRWKDNFSNKYLILSAVTFTLSAISKYNFFIIIGLMVLLNFPYRKFFNKRYLKNNYKFILMVLIILISIPSWMLYSPILGPGGSSGGVGQYLDMATNFLKANTWNRFSRMFIPYVKDNFTLIGFSLAMIFFFAAVSMYFRFNKKTKLHRFIITYGISTFIFVFIMLGKMSGHSYHWMDFSPLIAILLGYGATLVSNIVKNSITQLKKYPFVSYIAVFLVFLILIYPSASSAWERQFDTQFFGLDVAGNYIDSHKSTGERVMHSSHQAYGLLWHGDLKGTRGIPGNVSEMRFAINELNANWLFIYQWDFKIMQDERWNFIKENFDIKQIGFVQNKQGVQPYYFLLKKGEGFNQTEFGGFINEHSDNVGKKQYELTNRKVDFYFASE